MLDIIFIYLTQGLEPRQLDHYDCQPSIYEQESLIQPQGWEATCSLHAVKSEIDTVVSIVLLRNGTQKV